MTSRLIHHQVAQRCFVKRMRAFSVPFVSGPATSRPCHIILKMIQSHCSFKAQGAWLFLFMVHFVQGFHKLSQPLAKLAPWSLCSWWTGLCWMVNRLNAFRNALNKNYVKCALTLATFFKSFNHLTLTILLLVFPVSYCMHVLVKFHLCYTHYSICPPSLRHFLKNRRMQILSLFINVSLRQLFQTTVAFRFLMFYLKFWKDRFLHDLPASYPLAAWSSTRKMHCLNYLKLFIN